MSDKTRNEPPPGPKPAPVPSVPTGPGMRTVQFEGTVQLFVSDMPEASFVDLTDTGTHPVFACCWIDRERGATAHVEFPPGIGVGVFRVDLPMQDDDVNKVKVQLSMRMLDSATGNRRTVPLTTSCAHVGEMMSGKPDQFRMPDQFISGNFVNVSMRVLNLADFKDRPLRLRPSALDRIPEFNQHVRNVSKAIEDNNVLNGTMFVRGAESMRSGDSSREFAGRVNTATGEKDMEEILTHYAIMNAQEECVNRPLPLAVVIYHMYLKAVHSGMSFEQILNLDDVQFAQFGSESLQISCSAGIFPYEKDFVPGIGLSFFHGLVLSAVPTEDMVRVCSFLSLPADPRPDFDFVLVQGWPLTMGQVDGRTIRDIGKIRVHSRMTIAELMGLFEQKPLPPGSVRPLVAGSSFTPCEQLSEGVLPELYLSLCTDDCESSSLAARMAKLAVLAFSTSHADKQPEARVQALQEACQGWRVFQRFTPVSWRLMGRFVDRLGGMLVNKHLRIMTGVGLATNASAAEEETERAEYCGHCFNVGYIQTPSMSYATPFLLEGTAAMYSLHVDDSTPRVTVNLVDASTDKRTGETKVLDMPSFLSALSGTVMLLSTVINAPNGGVGDKLGWPLPVQVRGWLAKTNVTPALSSTPGTHLAFYNRIMYMGWPCTVGGQGCMPVQETEGKKINAGCHPYDLTKLDLRGVDATLPGDALGLMTDIMEEAVPPQARADVVKEIANRWIECRPLEVINREADLVRKPGVRYHRVVCMESPCAPEYLSIVHEAKRRFADETNRINDALPDSDGIRLYSLLEGVDDLLCVDVEDRTISKLTVVESMKQAMTNLAWPRKAG